MKEITISGVIFGVFFYIIFFLSLFMAWKMITMIYCTLRAWKAQIVEWIASIFPKIPLSRLSQSYLQNFIIKMQNPLERTTVVTLETEWIQVCKELLE